MNEKTNNSKKSAGIIIVVILLILVTITALSIFFIIKPEFKISGDKDMSIEAGSEFTDPGVSVTVKGKDLSDKITITDNVDTSKTGTYNVIYKLKYMFITFTAKRKVTVADTLPPSITLNGVPEINLFVGDEYIEEGAVAIDICDGDISSDIVITGEVDTSTKGVYVINYHISDKAGNSSDIERTVNVKVKPVSVEGSIIYLTFDDGPGSHTTPKNLDILKKNNISATFYILNYTPDQLPIIKRILEDGHTIGIHGYSHDYSKIYTSPDVAMDNFLKLRTKLLEDTGYAAYTFRFPGGSSNTVSRHYCKGIMTTLTSMVENAGYSYMDWNVSSGDASAVNLDSDIIVQNVTSALRHGRDNIVLMHDSDFKISTTEALQRIIDYGFENGYTFASIPEGMTPIHHPVNN